MNINKKGGNKQIENKKTAVANNYSDNIESSMHELEDMRKYIENNLQTNNKQYGGKPKNIAKSKSKRVDKHISSVSTPSIILSDSSQPEHVETTSASQVYIGYRMRWFWLQIGIIQIKILLC